jgi:hypothetical protein
MVWFALTVNVQIPVPVQTEPVHPENTNPDCGVAVSDNVLPESNAAEQDVLPPPHVIPAGVLVTVPPEAGAVTVTLNCGVGGGPKLATTA